jgi:GGDEF domain-containing protein
MSVTATTHVKVYPPTGDDMRLSALDRLDILDTPKEQSFERIAELMKLVFGVDASVVSVIDGHRQWYKAARGTDVCEVPVTESFCRYTVAGDGPLIVPDATLDERFKDNPHVLKDQGVRFYAGVPLKTHAGHNIGTLCIFDRRPRHFESREIDILNELAHMAMHELELRQVANTDVLTGILSRRAFKDDARRFVALARRHRSSLSCISIDVDHFKSINDTYGHGTGDKVLEAVTRAARAQLRESDLLGRLGGEEFAVLLPDADVRQARDVAENFGS